MKSWALVFLMFAVTSVASSAGLDCVSCHADKASSKDSAHAGLSCSGCHEGIQSFPHPEKATPVNCATCHTASAAALGNSVHASAGGPACLNCHGDAHSILRANNPRATTYPTNLPHTCGVCHGDAKAAKRVGLQEVYSLYMDSIHGFSLTRDGLLVAANCSSCHGSHSILSSKNPQSKTNRANIAATCGTCHVGPLQAFSSSIHGQKLQAGSTTAPACTSCHTAHQISKVGTAEWQMKTTATCGGCHQDQFATYHDTFHAQVSSLGYQATARCWDCHGYHDIRPASDPKSMIAPAQLTTTCGKCHAGANASFVKYDPHANSHDRAQYPALHYSAVFMNLLLAGALGFFALHTILWFLRLRFGPNTDAGPTPSLPK